MIADTPLMIEAYRLLSLRGGLKLRILARSQKYGATSFPKHATAVRKELERAGVKAPRPLAELLSAYETYLREIGVLRNETTTTSQSGDEAGA